MHFVPCSIVDCMKNDSMSVHMQTVDPFMHRLSQRAQSNKRHQTINAIGYSPINLISLEASKSVNDLHKCTIFFVHFATCMNSTSMSSQLFFYHRQSTWIAWASQTSQCGHVMHYGISGFRLELGWCSYSFSNNSIT